MKTDKNRISFYDLLKAWAMGNGSRTVNQTGGKPAADDSGADGERLADADQSDEPGAD